MFSLLSVCTNVLLPRTQSYVEDHIFVFDTPCNPHPPQPLLSRCTRVGSVCKYSKRKWHLPQPQQDQQRQQQPKEGLTNPPPAALLECGKLPFKR